MLGRSLNLKLILLLSAVSVTGLALVAVLSRGLTVSAFERYVLADSKQSFIDLVTNYYLATGSWQGVAENGRGRPLPSGGEPPRPEGRPLPVPFALADANGVVVVPTGPFSTGTLLPTTALAQGTPIEIDGSVVGTVLYPGGPPLVDARTQAFIARVNRSLLLSTFIALAVALAVGVLFTRSLTRPLRDMMAATTALSRGEYAQVPVRSRDELGELSAAFNQMSADLGRAERLRKQMTADIAHELRTPLTGVVWYLEAFRADALEASTEDFEVMYQQVQHLQNLVEDLRTLSLADAGELRLSIEPTHPAALLSNVASTLKHRAEASGVTLETRADDTLEGVPFDPSRIKQVLSNLVTNALRHTPEGGRVTLAAKGGQEGLEFTVTDTGAGIPADVLPHIFDRFYRADAARSQQGGSGLGLAIVKAIVEGHRGTVEVDSRVGLGTRFTVKLPLSIALGQPRS